MRLLRLLKLYLGFWLLSLLRKFSTVLFNLGTPSPSCLTFIIPTPPLLIHPFLLNKIRSICLRNVLSSSQSDHASGGFVATYLVPIGLIIAVIYWTADTIDGYQLFSSRLPENAASDTGHPSDSPSASASASESISALSGWLRVFKYWVAKIGFLAVSTSCFYVWGGDASCMGLRENKTAIGGGGKNDNGGKGRLVLLGLQNALGAPVLVFVAVVYMILAMFQKPMGGVMIGIAFIQVICLVELHAEVRLQGSFPFLKNYD